MRRIILFGYSIYYPCGGSTDIDGLFDLLSEVTPYVEKLKQDGKSQDIYEALDMSTGQWYNIEVGKEPEPFDTYIGYNSQGVNTNES
jgi:hypothetical protein